LVDCEVNSSGSRLGTALLFLRAVGTVLGAVLHVVIVHSEGLIDLAAKSSIVVNTVAMLAKSKMIYDTNLQRHKLRVVHLKQHTSDLARKLRLDLLDLGINGLTKHLLLLLGR
jgi:hypothetical protein